MKKIHLFNLFLAAMLMSGNAIAQSPRMQFFEYFDNNSIPSFGAVANAHFDSLADANSANVTFIKYHVAWGATTGTDVMNLQNPTQVQTRVNYYNDTTDPQANQDGGVAIDTTFAGQPSDLTQTFINHRNLATSPFTIAVSHTMNAANDTLSCHVVITKTGAAPGGLTAHVAVIEKLIHFATAPGASGDTYFRNVMKQMLPADTGTLLPAMAIGDSLVLNLKWKLANVYSIAQLAVVSFVQGKDSTNREVYQAGYSAPLPQANDAGISSVSTPQFSCDSVRPGIVLQNGGYNNLTTCNINYRVDNGTPVTLLWTGNIAPGASLNVTLPGIFYSGYHILKIYSSGPNGGADNNQVNDTSFTHFSNSYLPGPLLSATPIAGFESGCPPANWGLGTANPSFTWQAASVGGFGSSAKSARLDWYTIPAGPINDLYAPVIDLSTNGSNIPFCTFDVAYARYKPGYNDTLQVRVSTDCGITWATLYSKTDVALATAPDDTLDFMPASNQWRHEYIGLSAYNGQASVLIQFHGISGYGNSVYIDNVFVENAEGVKSINVPNDLKVYPNPANDILNITSADVISTVTITNLFGQTMYTHSYSATQVHIGIADLPNGMYLININGSTVRKFVKE